MYCTVGISTEVEQDAETAARLNSNKDITEDKFKQQK
jgi:hypothetical protein